MFPLFSIEGQQYNKSKLAEERKTFSPNRAWNEKVRIRLPEVNFIHYVGQRCFFCLACYFVAQDVYYSVLLKFVHFQRYVSLSGTPIRVISCEFVNYTSGIITFNSLHN